MSLLHGRRPKNCTTPVCQVALNKVRGHPGCCLSSKKLGPPYLYIGADLADLELTLSLTPKAQSSFRVRQCATSCDTLASQLTFQGSTAFDVHSWPYLPCRVGTAVVLQVGMKSQACQITSLLTLLMLLAHAHQANAAINFPGTLGPHRCHRRQYVAGNLRLAHTAACCSHVTMPFETLHKTRAKPFASFRQGREHAKL